MLLKAKGSCIIRRAVPKTWQYNQRGSAFWCPHAGHIGRPCPRQNCARLQNSVNGRACAPKSVVKYNQEVEVCHSTWVMLDLIGRKLCGNLAYSIYTWLRFGPAQRRQNGAKRFWASIYKTLRARLEQTTLVAHVHGRFSSGVNGKISQWHIYAWAFSHLQHVLVAARIPEARFYSAAERSLFACDPESYCRSNQIQ